MRTALVFVGLVVTLSAQAARPAFEVASVKKLAERLPPNPNETAAPSSAFYWANVTVASVIQFAYNVLDFELVGGPDWMRRDLFEINARSETETTFDEKRLMLQSLLEDRFKLVIRREKQEMRFSALALARSDGRLGPNVTACPDPNAPEPPVRPPRGAQVWVVRCGTIADLTQMAARTFRIPVVDKTGLTGMRHIEIAFIDPRFAASAGVGAQAPLVDPNLTDIGTAMREQLGLQLEPGLGPVDVLVVESVQQPTPD